MLEGGTLYGTDLSTGGKSFMHEHSYELRDHHESVSTIRVFEHGRQGSEGTRGS